jgi:hypothetical protein
MRVLLVLVSLLSLGGTAWAFTDADRAAVQTSIAQQLEAFRRDDGVAAYSFAAPGIRRQFPSEEIFMELVRRGYPAVYRSRSHVFGPLVETPTGLAQSVDILDAEGALWEALYTFERQPDGSWKISGCFARKKPGTVA